MNADLVLTCPSCAAPALADDEFCESCGLALGAVRDARRNHVEVEIERAAAVSDRGLRHVRNEDAVFLAGAGGSTIAVVCDGVSTAAAPQVAAQVAATEAGELLLGWLRDDQADRVDVTRALLDAIESAGKAVAAVPWMMTRVDVVSPSCTIVAAILEGSHVTVAWSGDSRAYWVGTEAMQLTDDHSMGEHGITRWLGADAPTDPVPVVQFRPVHAGRLILCTDGLWNHLQSASELRELVGEGRSRPIDVAGALTRCALERGGDDNVTVVVIDVHHEHEEMAA
jgi:serine/threonine protein phosphatase PrpC